MLKVGDIVRIKTWEEMLEDKNVYEDSKKKDMARFKVEFADILREENTNLDEVI